MRLTPNDIVNKQFSKSRGGYAATEVDEYLRQLAQDFEHALSESARFQQRLEEIERELERFEAMESTLKEALVLAQMAANETRALAQREADAILRDARSQADELSRDATWRSETLRQERLRFGWEFRALLQSQLDHLDAELERSSAPIQPAASRSGSNEPFSGNAMSTEAVSDAAMRAGNSTPASHRTGPLSASVGSPETSDTHGVE